MKQGPKARSIPAQGVALSNITEKIRGLKARSILPETIYENAFLYRTACTPKQIALAYRLVVYFASAAALRAQQQLSSAAVGERSAKSFCAAMRPLPKAKPGDGNDFAITCSSAPMIAMVSR